MCHFHTAFHSLYFQVAGKNEQKQEVVENHVNIWESVESILKKTSLNEEGHRQGHMEQKVCTLGQWNSICVS